MNNTCAVIPAAGAGLRMGGNRPKQFLSVSGKSILERTLETFCRLPFLSHVFLVVPRGHLKEASALSDAVWKRWGSRTRFQVVEGGPERQESVYNGLQALPAQCHWVIVHDGVRPFASSTLIESTWRASHATGASIAALPATETIKVVVEGKVSRTLPREQLWLVQTPQVFRKSLLLEAFERAREEGWTVTDDASLVECLGATVAVVPGERTNIKVTTPEDLEWGEWFLSKRL